MEGYNYNYYNYNQGFFGHPQGVWESEFPVGNSFLLRGTEKKTQTLKWSGKNKAKVIHPKPAPNGANNLHPWDDHPNVHPNGPGHWDDCIPMSIKGLHTRSKRETAMGTAS